MNRGTRTLALGACIATAAVAFAASGGAARVGLAARTMLPTEWQLAAAPGIVVATKTFPQSAVTTADGAHLIVVESGAGSPGIRILATRDLATERDIAMKDVYGVPLADATGSGFWIGTAQADGLAHVDAATGANDRTIALPHGFWPAGIARSPDGATLAVGGDTGDAIVFVNVASGAVSKPVKLRANAKDDDARVDHDVAENPANGAVATGSHPAGLAYSRDAKTLFVAQWAAASLATIDVATASFSGSIAVGKHPEFLTPSPDGSRLYVSETDDDAIGVVDVRSRARIADVNVAPYDGKTFGGSPTQTIVSKDGTRLYATLSAANAVAVVDVAGAMPRLLGTMPTGWYPTALAFAPNGSLDVVDGMGESGHANPHFAPFARRRGNDESGYVASSMIGSVRRIAIPSDAELANATHDVTAGEGPNARGGVAAPPDTVLRANGPIRHVIYVIKENRTYDQVLGDLTGANGDPSLTLFGERTTPNEHAIARRFGILDDTFADAEVSADGHNWSTAAFANDYLERMWPEVYGDRRKLYDFEDGAVASTPHAGYIWNDAARHGVTIRNYGEFVSDADAAGVVRSHMADLAAVTDPHFVGFDLLTSDLAREAEWAREFDAYAKTDTLPQLEIVRFPNDHTSGTKVGSLTPSAYNAQNDLAVGRMLEHLSHSRHWRDTAVFIVEDDAQNGPDHVDAQRMTAYLASPYAAGGLQHEHYSTAGIVRTIEIVLGLPPMSAYDAAARPLYAAFRDTADLRPYDALPERIDVDARNAPTAYRANESARLDFSHEDAVPDATLNDLVWHAVRGANAADPRYGAFPKAAR